MDARRRLLVAGAAGLTTVAVGVALHVGGDGDDGSSSASSRATATTSIRRQDLVETEEVSGTLGYAGSRTVVNRLPGTVTRTPKVGSVVKPNRPLYEIDGSAVYLLDGSYPAYRTLRPGLAGDDVRQLERNLRRLGLDADRAMTVDGSWDVATTGAVRRWQARKGMAQDGMIELGRVVFQPGARRIAEIMLPAGSSAPVGGGGGGGPSAPDAAAVMRTSSTKRTVVVNLETTKQDLAKKGAAVTVELPGGDEVVGTITRVGKVAQRRVTRQDGDPPATIEVVVKLKRSAGTDLDQAPVDVSLEQRRARNVLVVPVTALLARAGREFALEVRDGDRRRVVPVETGLYTDGYVEVAGRGLRAGVKVSNAKI